ncbi:MAG: hypothetical protein CMK82_11100 [Pseudomonadales bacterium]|uniref:MazG nucleotide pyrophosphohydrolase domain-containing protein n=1 Tax=Sphingobium sp. TaxID=1912891 RepID=UPI000C63C869|nr:MazG nucleotide pyrophosphohydrolase domain-containing protein [Sphingobium sp.]MAS67326.1 hypothetical protein [Pseudomonadales bacterium]MBS90824.1 hypothetical protein [Sphingobium sp.]
MMTTVSITHPQLVAALVKPPQAIIDTLSVFTVDLWHGATGVSGEAGELLEALMFPPEGGIDRVNLREELGDLFFYVEQIVQRSGVHIKWDAADEIARNATISPDQILPVGAAIAIHASQVLDTVKKAAIYNKELDLELLTNQISALAASMLTLCYMFGLQRQECLNSNILKLSKRYAALSYSDQAAQDRADKAQPEEGVIPARKPFKGEEDTRAHTPGVTEAHVPNAETQAAIQEVRDGDLPRHGTVENLMRDLNGEDLQD